MNEKVKALKERDKVRRKISMWLGASNHIAVLHTIKELVGNSIDEVNKGNGDTIKITLHDNKTVEVEDNCQGLPFEGKNDDGIENYKLLTETLFAGTKYENGLDNSNYTVGTNGVFLTVLTYSSEFVEYEVGRPDGNIYKASYKKGNSVDPLYMDGKTDKTYTKIKYTLDDDVFEDNYFDMDELCQIANEQASLIKGTIIVANKETGEESSFYYENGIVEFLESSTKDLDRLHPVINFDRSLSHKLMKDGKEVTDDVKLNIAIQYTREDTDLTQIEFLNGSNLIHHGTIYDGLIAGLRVAVNNYIKKNNLYTKNEKQISKDDILIGLHYVVDFKSYFPIYANQTKFASYVKYYEPIMKQAVENFFEYYSVENRAEMNLIALQVLTEKRSREKSEKIRLDVKKKLSGSVNNLTSRIEGFVNCTSKDKEKTELYVVEGKSAMGSTQQGRDRDLQAIYALRGKILNCLKADYQQIFKNEIIIELIRIMGCGVEVKSKHAKDVSNFDINNLKWSKIIITTDADMDGYHIRTLLLTLIKVLTPQLIEEGFVYIADSPLYEISSGDEVYLAYSDKEKDQIVSKMTGDILIQRSKGLGENTAQMMWDTTMNPKTRKLIQVTPEEIERTNEVFELFLGDNLPGRKQYIEENLYLYLEDGLE